MPRIFTPTRLRLLAVLSLVGFIGWAATFSRLGQLIHPFVTAAGPTTRTVTNTDNSGAGSLRQAILDAASGDTIVFDIPTSDLGYDAATGRYTITLFNEQLLVDKDLTIKGPGPNRLTVRRTSDAGAAKFRIFYVLAPVQVTISGMTISNGNASAGDPITPQGGGIYNQNTGKLIISDCVISNNSADSGGGGLATRNNTVLIFSTVRDNTSGSVGGGITTLGNGTQTIISSTISGNTASMSGGGIYNGSIFVTLNLINVTLSGNTATNGYGGGLDLDNATKLDVTNSTITNNKAFVGGGIANTANQINGVNGEVTLKNSIVALNTAGVLSPDVYSAGSNAPITSQGYNIVRDTSNSTISSTTGDQFGVDPHLSALGDFGGPSETHLPLSNSTARNSGSNALLPPDTFNLDGDGNTTEELSEDGRGYARVLDVVVDIGAVETSSNGNYALYPIEGSGQSAQINTAFATPLKVLVKESGVPKSGVQVGFQAPPSNEPSGTFAVNSMVTTDSNGIAVAPAFTANGVAGNYQVYAYIQVAPAPVALFNLTNARVAAQVALSNLVHNYDGTQKAATVTTTPAGLSTGVTYNGASTPPTNAGSYAVVATVTDPNYSATPATGTLIINKAVTTTTVTVSSATFDGGPHGGTASVTGPAGPNQFLTVTYTGRNSTVYGPSTFAPTNAGDYTASASYTGDANRQSSSDSKDFQITKANQTITFNALPNKTYGDADFNPGATASSNLSVSYAASGQCVINSTLVHLTGAGSCTITASQAGNNNYNKATDVQQTFSTDKATRTPTVTSSVNPSDFGQSVTFTARVQGNAFTVVPTGTVQFKVDGATAGAALALDSNGAASFSTSGLAAGTHTITVDYSGEANFNATTGALSSSQVVRTPPTLSINDVTITEGNGGTKNALFTVSLSTSSNLNVTVDFATSDGTATAGSDYQAASGSLTFTPFQTIKTVTVVINGDTKDEPNETFSVNLSNQQNASLLKAQGKGTILNDDAPGVGFSGNGYLFNEGAGHGDITINRSGDISSPITVDYATFDQSGVVPCQNNSNGSASDRCDYVTAIGTLRFAANEQTKVIPLVLVDDAYLENAENLFVRLSNPKGANLSSVDTVTVTITDNDSQPATKNPITDQPFFIRQQYIDFLGREPDQGGFQFWMNRMNGVAGFCQPGEVCDRIDTSQRFFQSDEFQERGFYVYRLYDAVLGRLPHYVEFVPDVARLNGFQTPQEQRLGKDAYLLDFMVKQEFRNLYGAYVSADGLTAVDAAGFVNALCQKAAITPASKQTLIDNLANGTRTPAQTLEDFILTPEISGVGTKYYDRGFITMQYFGYLRRDPDTGGFNFWVGQLIGENAPHKQDYRFMVGGFLQSDEYNFRFALLSSTP